VRHPERYLLSLTGSTRHVISNLTLRLLLWIVSMVVLSIDLDAFYCTVEQKYDPSLDNDTPFIVYQKDCIATLSYAARALGIKKLGSVAEAKKRFPGIRVVNGESLAKYRHEGKLLCKFIQNLVQVPVERLGLEELRFDISDIVDYNVKQLQSRGLLDFERLQVEDDEEGVWLNVSTDHQFFCEDFFFNIGSAKLYPPEHGGFLIDFKEYVEYYVGAHLALYIQERITTESRLSASIGVAKNITLAKMICSYNKPSGVSLLVPPYGQQFLNPKLVKHIPGFGHATMLHICRALDVKGAVLKESGSERKIENGQEKNGRELRAQNDGDTESSSEMDPTPDTLTVQNLLENFSAEEFNQLPILKPSYLWDLLHGIDNSIIQETPLYPNQISIENSYSLRGLSFDDTRSELRALCVSLLKQLYVDIIDAHTKSWIAYPTSLRLAIRHTGKLMLPYPSRRSKTTPVYSYVYELCQKDENKDEADIVAMASRIVEDNVYPMLEELWKPVAPNEIIKLLNVAATNMVEKQPPVKRPPGSKRNLHNYFG
jgi:DNA polymerase iota